MTALLLNGAVVTFYKNLYKSLFINKGSPIKKHRELAVFF